MARMCLSCVLELRLASHKLEKSPEKLSCALCAGPVVQKTVLCHSTMFLVDLIRRTFQSLKGKGRAGMRTVVTNYPRQVFDRDILPLGVAFKHSKSRKKDGLFSTSVSVRVTCQKRLNSLMSFEQYFPTGCGAFKSLKRGEVHGIAVPVIFRHSITRYGEHRLNIQYNSLVFNLGGRLVIPPGYPLTAKSWGKSSRFCPASYIKAEFAKSVGLLLGRGVSPTLLRHSRSLMEEAAKAKEENNVWADCSAEDQLWYASRAKFYGIPPAGQELRRSARLLGKLFIYSA